MERQIKTDIPVVTAHTAQQTMTHPMSSTTPKFFGLTALGAPDPWHNNLVDTVLLDIFTDEDVRISFERKQGPQGGVVLEGMIFNNKHSY
jgi:hypothetical protein